MSNHDQTTYVVVFSVTASQCMKIEMLQYSTFVCLPSIYSGSCVIYVCIRNVINIQNVG